MNRLPRRLATASGLIFLASTPLANAGTVTLDRTCYVERQAMTATGTGFAPNASITLSGNGAFANVETDQTGTFVTALAVPINPTTGARSSDIAEYALSASDSNNVPQATPASYRVANFAYTVADTGGNPRKKRRFDLSGFPQNSTVYAHYRFGGKTLGSVRFGKAQGACGQLKANQALLPSKVRLRYGAWRIQFDTKRTYSAKSLPRLTTGLTIFRSFR